MILLWLASRFPRLWRWRKSLLGAVAALAAAGAVWWQIDSYGDRRASEATKAADARWHAKQEADTAAHNARLKEIDSAHTKDLSDLAAARDAALARPAVRTIRVPVSATCPAAPTGPEDASLPAGADPESEHVDVVDTGYGPFRDWLIQYAAGPS